MIVQIVKDFGVRTRTPVFRSMCPRSGTRERPAGRSRQDVRAPAGPIRLTQHKRTDLMVGYT